MLCGDSAGVKVVNSDSSTFPNASNTVAEVRVLSAGIQTHYKHLLTIVGDHLNKQQCNNININKPSKKLIVAHQC